MTIAQAGVVMYGRTALLLRARVEGRKGGAVSQTHRALRSQLTGSAAARRGSRGSCRRHSAQHKNKSKGHEPWSCVPLAVQSTAAKTPNYSTKNQHQKVPIVRTHVKNSQNEALDFLIRKVTRIQPQTVQVFITGIRCSNHDPSPSSSVTHHVPAPRRLRNTPLLFFKKTTRMPRKSPASAAEHRRVSRPRCDHLSRHS